MHWLFSLDNFWKQKIKNTNIQLVLLAIIFSIKILAILIKKRKLIKNILDKKATASIAAFILQFLQAENQKNVYTIGLTSY